jgi:hypothetical protein
MRLSSPERKTYRIYGLVDPRTGETRYVGQTADLLGRRLQDHIRKPGATKKGDWVREVLAADLDPTIYLIEELVGYRPDAYKRESYWINRLRDEGQPLTN